MVEILFLIAGILLTVGGIYSLDWSSLLGGTGFLLLYLIIIWGSNRDTNQA